MERDDEAMAVFQECLDDRAPQISGAASNQDGLFQIASVKRWSVRWGTEDSENKFYLFLVEESILRSLRKVEPLGAIWIELRE